MKHKSDNIYCIDTSALVTMHRFYPLRFLPDLWKHLEVLFKNKKILSHDFVYDEIVPDTGIKSVKHYWFQKYYPFSHILLTPEVKKTKLIHGLFQWL